jgi:hypothetical protein
MDDTDSDQPRKSFLCQISLINICILKAL